MKFRWFIPLGFIAITLSAQSISSPNGGIIFSTATLTNVYTASTAVDVQSWDSVSIIATVPTAQASAVAKIKPQWSNDNTTWVDQNVFQTNAISGSETPISLTSKQVTLQLTNASSSYVELYPRVARYFRVSVASTNVLTTATLNITAQKLNNGGSK